MVAGAGFTPRVCVRQFRSSFAFAHSPGASPMNRRPTGYENMNRGWKWRGQRSKSRCAASFSPTNHRRNLQNIFASLPGSASAATQAPTSRSKFPGNRKPRGNLWGKTAAARSQGKEPKSLPPAAKFPNSPKNFAEI